MGDFFRGSDQTALREAGNSITSPGLLEMYPYTAKLGLSNDRKRPLLIYVEPWANDYTLLPGEELELIAFSSSAVPWFHVVEWDGGLQVLCNDDTADFKVIQAGVELQCGHNRQPEGPDSPTN